MVALLESSFLYIPTDQLTITLMLPQDGGVGNLVSFITFGISITIKDADYLFIFVHLFSVTWLEDTWCPYLFRGTIYMRSLIHFYKVYQYIF